MSLEEFERIDASDIPVGKLISMAARGINIYANHHLEDYNINTTQIHLLFEIAHEKNINQEKIASRCNINKGSVARSIKKMEDEGLVLRQIDENNRRQNIVSLTDKGEKTLLETLDILDGWEDEVVNKNNLVEKELLQNILKQIVISTIKLNQKESKNE